MTRTTESSERAGPCSSRREPRARFDRMTSLPAGGFRSHAAKLITNPAREADSS